MRAFVVDAREGDAGIRAAVDQAGAGDRMVLIADEASERRAEILGVRTGAVFGPAALRRVWPLPASAASRSLRACLDSFDELVFSSAQLLDAATRACAGRRSLPLRRVIGVGPAERVGVANVSRASVRESLCCGDEVLIALACDPGDACSASDFVRVCQILAIVGHRVTALVPREAPDLARAKEIVRSTGIGVRLLTTNVPVWSLVPGLDAAVIDVAESPLATASAAAGQRWMMRCCATLGVHAVIASSLVDDVSQFACVNVSLAESRLPVHIARSLDAALRGGTRGATSHAEPSGDARTQAVIA
jgi:hypothetical protein